MEGYLKKKSHGPIKKWQTRYFELNRHILTYYDDAPSNEAKQEPKGEFNMRDMKSLGIDPGNQLVIVLNLETSDEDFADSRALHIRCPDNKFYQAWLSCFVVFVANDRNRCMIPTAFAGPIWILIEYLGQPWIARTEGLFRIPGEKSTTDSLRQKLTVRHAALIPTKHRIDLAQYPITALTSVLKCLIDRMPNTLLTENLYEDFISLYLDSQVKNRLSKVKALLERLPSQSLKYIHHLCLCLNRVSQTKENKMDEKTLAILFGAMFVSRKKTPLESVRDFKPLQNLLEDLILNHVNIFIHSPPVFETVVPKLQLVLTNVGPLSHSVSAPMNHASRKNTFEKFFSGIKEMGSKKTDTALANNIKRLQDTDWRSNAEIVLPNVGEDLPYFTVDESSEVLRKLIQPEFENNSKLQATSTVDVAGRSRKSHSDYGPKRSSIFNLDSCEVNIPKPYKKRLYRKSRSIENSRDGLSSTISQPVRKFSTPVFRYNPKHISTAHDDYNSTLVGGKFDLDDSKLYNNESRPKVNCRRSSSIYL